MIIVTARGRDALIMVADVICQQDGHVVMEIRPTDAPS
jgi:hypothetical protein